MDWPLIVIVGVFLGALFSILGYWHRSIEAAHNRQLSEEIDTAKQEGADQALTQHPQIDVNHCIGCGSCVQACPEHGVLAVVEGRARLVRASYCVGHGLCEKVCPVGALTVGLGDVSTRDDIPILSDDGETSVPGVFIAGELGGFGLIRHAITQGTQCVENIARRMKAESVGTGGADPVDLLIVGCGPTGIAAALRAHELGLSFTVIDQEGLGGSVRKYPRHKMTLTQPVDLPIYGRMKKTQYQKEELIELWEQIFDDTGIEVHTGVRFTDLDRRADGTLNAVVSTGLIHCRHCLLALGRRGTPRRLGVPGEEAEHVVYQLIDAADYRKQNLLVVGGGDSAIEAAVALASQPGNQVTLSYRRHAFFRIKPRNRENLDAMVAKGRIKVQFETQVKQIGKTESVLTRESEELRVAADYVFVLAGGEPPYPLLKGIGIRFGEPEPVHEEAAALMEVG